MVASRLGFSLRSFVAFPCVVPVLSMMAPTVSMPNVTVPNPSKSPILLPLRRDSVPVRRKGEIVSYKTSYSGLISVGQPAQEFRVVFDTGSGHIVLPSIECKSKTCLVHQRYDMKASKSAVAINVDGTVVPEGEMSDQVTIGYGTGQVTGEFVKDQVCIGTASNSQEIGAKPGQSCEMVQVVSAVEMSKQPFKNLKFDGILGLGLASLSLSKSFSFFDILANGGKAGSPHFSVFLTDGEDGDESEIAVGGINPDRLQGSLSWAPVSRPELGYWQLELLAVRVDGRELDICKNGGCHGVMDTGTSHLGIPSSHNDMLGDLLTQPAAGISDCRRVTAPTLEFEFHGFNMTLHPEDYMRKLPLADDVQIGSSRGVSLDSEPEKAASTKVVLKKPAQTKPNYECRPRLMPVNLPAPLGPNLFILGEPVLHRYYTVFDWSGPQIGFGLASKRKPAAGGLLLGNGAKLGLSTPAVDDEVILVQLAVTFECRRSATRRL